MTRDVAGDGRFDGRDDLPGGLAGEEVVSAYLDGEATEAERRELEARVAASGDWREALARTAAARRAVRSAPWPEVPSGFWAAVTEAVEADAGSRGRSGSGIAGSPPAVHVRRPVARRAAVWAAGAAAAAVVAGFLLPRPSQPVSPSVPSYVESHAARASIDDPITQLAPVGVLVSLSP